MSTTFNLLVALAPAIAVAMLGSAIAVAPTVKRFWPDLIQSGNASSSRAEIVLLVALYGAVAGAILGFQYDSPVRVVIVAVWFVLMPSISFG